MKKNLTMALWLLAVTLPMNAQVYKETDKSVKTRITELYGHARKGVQKAGKDISDFLGFESRKDSDLVEIDGVKYMPLYTRNLFYADSTGMLAECRKAFKARYPKARILSVAIPQKSWIETAVKDDDRIVAYKRLAYCFVLAADGSDGYINAKYSFKGMREPGQEWVMPKEYWPHFEKADAIPNIHYKELKEK
jgi:hypothetical protein